MDYAANMDGLGKRTGLALVSALVFCFVFGPALVFPGPAAGQQVVVGGPCHYDIFPGLAEIVSVEPITVSGETRASISFVFRPDEPLPASWARLADQTQELKMVNGMDPTISFMEKYELEVGRSLACQLKIINQGTCTPALFDFPEVDRTDYQP